MCGTGDGDTRWYELTYVRNRTAPPPPLPLQRYGGGMFGRHLEETMALESRLGGRYIPLMVHKCVEFVRKHGEEWEGEGRVEGEISGRER